MELILLCELLGGRVLEEGDAADLVAALGRRVGLLEEAASSGDRALAVESRISRL